MRILVTLLLVMLAASPAAAKQAPTCKTPRNAADSVFAWQLGDQKSLAQASRCFERRGRTRAELEETARRLKVVFDAEGAFVDAEDLPDQPNWVHPDDKAQRISPSEELPEVVIAKRGNRWVWTKDSLDWIDEHYEESLQGLDRIVAKLPDWFHVTFFEIAVWQYVALALLLIVGWLIRTLISVVVAPKLKRTSRRLGKVWPRKLLEVIASPGATLLTAVVMRLGYPQLRLPIEVSRALASTVRVLITLSIVWAVYRAVDLLSAVMEERAAKTTTRLDDQLVPLMRKSLKVVVFIVGTLVVLQNLEFNVTTLVANVSIGTLALGLAAKDTIANLFGSISIFVDTPFQIGDWICVDDTHGTVEEVGFRSTRIRTFYDSVVVMPNAKLADAKIDNYGQREYRRCFATLCVTYDTTPEQMQAFCEGIRAVIQANEHTRKDFYEVHMSGFGTSSLEVMVYFFFHCETWAVEIRERHNVFLEIMRLARDLGVSFAFPTQTLHIEELAESGPRRLPQAPEEPEMAAVVGAYGPGGRRARPKGPSITETKHVADTPVRRGREDDGG